MDIKKKLPLIIGIVSGFLAVMLAANYIQNKEKEYRSKYTPREFATAVYAVRDIRQGQTISEKSLALKKINADYLQPRAARSIDRVVGKKAAVDIYKDEQISLSKLASTLKKGPVGLAVITPKGKRAVTIPIDSASSVGGMIKPGDRVDIMANIPISTSTEAGVVTQQVFSSVFQNVLVLAVGNQISGYSSNTQQQKSFSDITLALTAQEAAFLSFVQEQTKIKLLLRSPEDKQIEAVAPASWATLQRYLYGYQTPPAPPPTVEIYRGVNKKELMRIEVPSMEANSAQAKETGK
ncbi:MAG: Flp pilus assembly protein CpaB [Candidatus Gygaella obscura]|nr:Flp pilus assembly protein CpaB [Candidatus Gygaella obscura]